MARDLPYFKWYPSDAEMDEDYASMSDQELGFYHRCLNRSWTNEGLPGDLNEVARTFKRTRSYVDRMWKRVGKKFELRDTRLVNPRQELERADAITKSEKAGQSAAQQQKIKVPGFVYLIRRSDGAVKIGSSANVSRRLAQLRYKYRETSLELVGQVPVTSMGDVELALHGEFKHKRVTGEWFSLSEDDVFGILTPGGDMRGDSDEHPPRHARARADSDSESDSDSGLEVIKKTKTNLAPDDFGHFLVGVNYAELPHSDMDIGLARAEWTRLSFEQKLAATAGLIARKDSGDYDDPKYRPLPQNYVSEHKWQRPIRGRARDPATEKVHAKRNEVLQLTKAFGAMREGVQK